MTDYVLKCETGVFESRLVQPPLAQFAPAPTPEECEPHGLPYCEECHRARLTPLQTSNTGA